MMLASETLNFVNHVASLANVLRRFRHTTEPIRAYVLLDCSLLIIRLAHEARKDMPGGSDN